MDKKRSQSGNNRSRNVTDRQAKVCRIFELTDVSEQPSYGQIDPYPRFKKLNFLKPSPYGIGISDNLENWIVSNQQIDIDKIRNSCLNDLHAKRGRNVVVYYSGFWQYGSVEGTEIRDSDMGALLKVVNGLDSSKGLDLILHTPGGNVETAEMMGTYLREVFGTDSAQPQPTH